MKKQISRTIICPKCKTGNQGDAQFCDSCGEKLQSQNTRKRQINVVDSSGGGITAIGDEARAISVDGGSTYIEKQILTLDHWKFFALLAVICGILIFVAFMVRNLWKPEGQAGVDPLDMPTSMLGEFNIAVGQFEIVQGNLDPQTGLAVSQQIYQRIAKNLQSAAQEVDIVYEVRGPGQIGVIEGATPDQRAAAAAQLAEQINADVVIFGTIADDGQSQTIAPVMYISERLFSVIPEFLGRHPLGEPVLIPGGAVDLPNRVEANRDIAGRAQAIAYIATGVSLFNLSDYEGAFTFFDLALQTEGWEGEAGKESIYLMLGNAAGKLEKIDQAENYFQRALEINPQYARAYIGLGETYFIRALGVPPVNSFAEISQDDLSLAEQQYRAALSVSDQPPSADTQPKADFGLGRLSLVWYQILGTQSYLSAAAEYFRVVIAEAEAGNTRIAELAAQAHGHLGTIALLSSDLATAQAEYQIAAEATQSPRAKAAFWAQLGYVYHQLGETNLAVDAYQQAISIAPDEDSRQKYQQALIEIQKP